MALYHLYVLLLPLLQAFWVTSANSYVLSTRQSPITAAPVLNHFDERQNEDQVTCSQWSILDAGGVPVCSVGRTCIFNYDIPYWGCYPSTQTGDVFVTACYDWPISDSAAGEQTLFCPSSAPSCGAFLLKNTAGVTYTNLGCSGFPYDLVATQVEAFATSQAALPTTVFVSASAASPVTVFISATNPAPVTTASSMTSPTSSSTVTSSTSSTTSTAPTPGPVSTGSNAATVGGAVGGAVGGLALITVGIVIWLYLRKQHRRDQMEQSSKQPGIQSPGLSPYSAQYSPGQMANC